MELSQLFQRAEPITEADLSSIFPDWNRNDPLQLNSSLLRLYLHPIFTKDLAWLHSAAVDKYPCSAELFTQVAQAARSYIELLADSYCNEFVFCIWSTMERVLQASFVWVIFVIYQIQTSPGHGRRASRHDSDLFVPLSRCDFLLISLSEKWKPGLPYYRAWDVVHTAVLNLRYH